MTQIARLSESEQDVRLMQLFAVAQLKVDELVRRIDREDAVQALAERWLAELRAGTWDHPVEGVELFVERAVREWRDDDLWRRRQTLECDTVYLKTLTELPREWMDQDLMLEAKRVDAIEHATCAILPRKYVRATQLVCEYGFSTAAAAERLGTTVQTISKWIALVQGIFRVTLRRWPVAPRPSARCGHPQRTSARPLTGCSRTPEVRARRMEVLDRTPRVVVECRPDATAGRVLSPARLVDAHAPAVDATAPGEDATAPGEDATAPGEDATALGKDATTTAKDATTRAKESPARANDAIETTVVSPAPTMVERAATKRELEGGEATPAARKGELAPRKATLGTRNVQLVIPTDATVPTIASLGAHDVTPAAGIDTLVPPVDVPERAKLKHATDEDEAKATFDATARAEFATVRVEAEFAPMSDEFAPMSDGAAPMSGVSAPLLPQLATGSLAHAGVLEEAAPASERPARMTARARREPTDTRSERRCSQQ